MKRINKKHFFRILIITGSIAAVIFSVLLLLKNPVFRNISENRIRGINQKYSIYIEYGQLRLKGFNKIRITGLSVENDGLSLLSANNLTVKISPLKALFGKIDLKKVDIDSFCVNLNRDSSHCSYYIRKRKAAADTSNTLNIRDYRKQAQSLFRFLEGFLPSSMNIKSFQVYIRYFNENESFLTNDFHLKNNHFEQLFHVYSKGESSGFKVKYTYLPAKHEVLLNTEHLTGHPVVFPFLLTKYKLSLYSRNASFSIRFIQMNSSTDRFEGQVRLKDARIHHFRISSDSLNIRKTDFHFAFNIKSASIELDSNSFVLMNNFKVNLYSLYDKTKGKRAVFAFHIPRSDVKDLINSIPKGVFENLEGFDATGEIAYRFLIDVDLQQPDSLVFFNKLYRYDFQVKNFGKINTQRLLSEFEYTAYKKEVPVRTFMVGPSNPYFTNIDQISPYLKKAVLYSEDGAFYYHAGFIEEAIREAIITNIKHRRFVRGGSTITMQFVKNMFLNSKKVMTRKIEEIIITWLIERYRLLPKDRIFEIYLNFIEWGPNVYGVGEASDFYFHKKPSQINLDEAIFMAGIIPRPTSFMWVFDNQGKLKSFFVSHCRFVAGRMLKKEAITQEEYDNFKADVSLTGRAKEFLKTDTISSDTTFIEVFK
ncbi:MAG TPA: biosynthetic peptidoglycan transglycosylase [Bacteroidia bacterium]|nr:biosynthetic peptidoglycan transglycosylase [Bacteroidia bacterium]HRS57949.1 biosynthetic peptidoglycan transglycosylase [Bacteroidia bacterium]HRU67992.1 biosynthetic peptidoglycan transglycosylase [Bacteroidia bacterium]